MCAAIVVLPKPLIAEYRMKEPMFTIVNISAKDIPVVKRFHRSFGSNVKCSRPTRSSGTLKMMNKRVTTKEIVCERTVAIAAPGSPKSQTATKSKSSPTLIIVEKIRIYNGVFESPIARRKLATVL